MKIKNGFGTLVLIVFFSGTAMAGGPIILNEEGLALSWVSPITLHLEAGTCAGFSNAQMKTKVEENIAPWGSVVGADLEFLLDSTVVDEDVNASNIAEWFGVDDSVNPVIYDDDGSIVAALLGDNNTDVVLGFAGPEILLYEFRTILGGKALINCRCLAGNEDCGDIEFSEADLDFTMLHEIGHMIGLDHSQVNYDMLADLTTCLTDVANDCEGLPTMFPLSVDAAEQQTLERDDEVALLALYGTEGLATDFATVTLSLTDADGLPLRCADVQAQTDDPAETISAVSGINAPNIDNNADEATDGEGECLSNCGDVLLQGLSASDVTIKIQPIAGAFTGGSGIAPCINGQIDGIEEETVATISAEQLSAGSTVALGTLQTLSNGGSAEGADETGEDTDTGDDSADSGDSSDSGDDTSSGDSASDDGSSATSSDGSSESSSESTGPSPVCRLMPSARPNPVLWLLINYLLLGFIFRCRVSRFSKILPVPMI